MNGAPRTSNSVIVISSLLICLLVAGFEIVQGKTHVVGDVQGWDLYPNLTNWPKGKQFYAGDVLVFNYNTKGGDLYSPAKVDKSGYDKCDCSSVKMRNRLWDRLLIHHVPSFLRAVKTHLGSCYYGKGCKKNYHLKYVYFSGCFRPWAVGKVNLITVTSFSKTTFLIIRLGIRDIL
ncbi:hypothetical protein MKW98_031199 [Papaver atlanticum]|uniref:Phytocyanin domain-containing protein n=1 Tax=Papaver atlanticum TaxID=357466 RepID=A0AAD4T527_9MAGN|nr:hypothetical protein MKW98_031199 [Papaver atlanticum]